MQGLGLIAKKKGMTRVFNQQGEVVPVTVLQAGPCAVVQKKTKARDGYDAVQLGFSEETRPQRLGRARKGHFAKRKTKLYKNLREFRPPQIALFTEGQELDVNLFQPGDIVDVQGITKGRGFQGVIKRHGKAGGPATHGSHFHRAPGSIGMCADPGRVFKNMKLPGHMGAVTRTAKNLEIVAVDAEENALLVKGAVPGSREGVVLVVKRTADGGERLEKPAAPADEPITESTK